MDELMIRRILSRLTKEIIADNPDPSSLVFVGIKANGEYLARRFSEHFRSLNNKSIPWCGFDASYYLDNDLDIGLSSYQISINIQNKNVILVNDVLRTGRTSCIVVDKLLTNKQPKSVRLAVLVDCGLREVPIRADYIGKSLPIKSGQSVTVRLKEYDNEEGVFIYTHK